MKQKLPIIVAVVVGVIGVGVFFTQFSNKTKNSVLPEKTMDATAAPSASPAIASLSFEAIVDDQTALDLLKDSAQVEYEEFDFGVMVTGINGVVVDEKHYWALYVNDEYATAGASETILKTGDTMKWVYEEISQTPLE
ncbi:MAG: DUF4430 domain-containing protein [Candidatus Pacebacteria bacterium]|nr:DUF4430 domain-containing protein [Candidatus Paceibacterota bacterium]PIR60044.1 MAG: hypothetical protein COU67_03845 [Candidatus Pacebacteria bacterium CG10_big_fil_rev_8_21_14_0_10_44_54]